MVSQNGPKWDDSKMFSKHFKTMKQTDPQSWGSNRSKQIFLLPHLGILEASSPSPTWLGKDWRNCQPKSPRGGARRTGEGLWVSPEIGGKAYHNIVSPMKVTKCSSCRASERLATVVIFCMLLHATINIIVGWGGVGWGGGWVGVRGQ